MTSKGGALISALIAVIVISAMALGLTSITMTSNGAVMDTEDRYQALLLAETGMSIAYKTVDFMPSTVAEFTGTNLENLTTNLASGVLYQKQLDNNREIVVVKRKTADGDVMLEATGKVEKKLILGNVTRIYRTLQAVCKSTSADGSFIAGAFGLEGLSVNGNFATDSYDSAHGNYSNTKGHAGDIGTNKTISKGTSNAFSIDGSVWVGPGQVLWDGGSQVTGTTKNLDAPVAVSLASYSPAAGALTNFPSSKDCSVASGTNYRLCSFSKSNGSITVTGTGTVNIWVDGAIDLKCDIKLTTPTTKLLLWQAPGSSTLTVNGGGSLNTSSLKTYPAQTVTYPAGTVTTQAIYQTINKGNGVNTETDLQPYSLAGGFPNGDETIDPIVQSGTVVGWTIITAPQTTLQTAYVHYYPERIDATEGLPGNFSIISHTTGQVKMNGGSNFFGTILAPNAPVQINGNADVFGAVLGKTMDLSGTGDFHNDTNAKSPGFASKPFIASYVEVPAVVPLSD